MTSRRSACVLGTGLLGSSVGLSLRGAGWVVSGWDPDVNVLTEAVERGAIAVPLDNLPDDDVDLLVLASPPDAVVSTLKELRTESLVTDIAGVKTPIVAAASHLRHFVGGHPMAGGETSGPAMASSSLFHGATWVLTTDGATETDLKEMEDVVSSLGANPLRMTVKAHDTAVATVSHLPHVLAAALIHMVGDDPASLALAGGGLRDLTRIAAGDSSWWAEVLEANAGHVADSVDRLTAVLDSWKPARGSELSDLLEKARQARLTLGEHHQQVRVVLLDKPGEIARIGHALEQSRVDVRDFQLRHGEHGGGGILTISVGREGTDALVSALYDEGFDVRFDRTS